LKFHRLGEHSPHVTDFYTNIEKASVPQVPKLPDKGIVVKFYDKDFRNKVFDLLQDAKKAANWNVPFKRPDSHVTQMPTVAVPSSLGGVAAIKKTIEN
jgi:hypothetical protein